MQINIFMCYEKKPSANIIALVTKGEKKKRKKN